MKLSLAVTPYRAAFARPIATARGPWHERRGLWVVVRDEDGVMGLGEVAPLPDWGTETLEEAQLALEHLSRAGHFSSSLVGEKLAISALQDGLRHSLQGLGLPPAAYAGAELALLDWRARRAGLSLSALLAPAPRSRVRLNALVAAIAPEVAAREACACVAAGFTTRKLKVGAVSPEEDLPRLQAVRRAVGESIALRLDANGAWNRDDAISALRAFAAVHPEYVEQPVVADDLEGLALVRRRSGVPVAADESLRDMATARRLMASEIDVLVLKPLALGGLLNCLAIAHEAQSAGKRVVITSALDRGIGTLGALHLAAALESDTPAGLATAGIFADGALAPELLPRDGCLEIPAGPGLGLDPARLLGAVAR